MTMLKKTLLGTALIATALSSATPALADSYGGYHRGNGGDTAGAAVAGGIIGLAIGALIASAGNKHRCDGDRDDDRRCYDRRYQDGYNGGGYYNGYPAQGGYYNNGGGYYAQNGYYNGGRGYYEGRRHHDHDDDRGYRGY